MIKNANHSLIRISVLLLVLLITFLSISSRGCPKRSDKKGGSSNPGGDPFIVAAPNPLTAIAVSPSQINLTWTDNSNNEDGFRIERSINTNTNFLLLTTVGSSPDTGSLVTYSDTGLNPQTRYYYRVQAYMGSEYSSYSIEASAITYAQVIPSFKAIAAGNGHSAAVANDGTAYSWGLNYFGQLGVGDTVNRWFPTLITSDWNENSFGNVVTIVADKAARGGMDPEARFNGFNITLKTAPEAGTIWGWGANGAGTLATGDNLMTERPIQMGNTGETDWSVMAAGRAHSLGIKTNSTLWSSGYNFAGQLGLSDTIDRNTATLVTTELDWRTINAGFAHSLAIKTNGTLWTWGWNDKGQLGLGDSDDRDRPNQIGSTPSPHPGLTATLISLSRVDLSWTNTNNEDGFQILRTITTTPYILLTTLNQNVTSYSDTTIIYNPVTTNTYSYRIKAFNNVGENYSLPVSLAITTGAPTVAVVSSYPIPILETDWLSIFGHSSQTLALKTNRSLWAWGYGYYGQLGLGISGSSAGFRATPTRVGNDTDWSTVAAGYFHTLALKTNGTLWAWGDNRSGQLGLADGSTLKIIPTLVNTATDWLTISAGYGHSLALKTSGIVWVWGLNDYGQLGLSDTVNRNAPSPLGN